MYRNLEAPASHGPLVCSATPASGPNTWNVWTAPGAEASEAQALCDFFKRSSGVSVTWAAGQEPAAAPAARAASERAVSSCLP